MANRQEALAISAATGVTIPSATNAPAITATRVHACTTEAITGRSTGPGTASAPSAILLRTAAISIALSTTATPSRILHTATRRGLGVLPRQVVNEER